MCFEKKIFKKYSNLISRKVENEYIIVPTVDNIANMNVLYTLNETGAFIFEQIDGEKTIEDIIKLINSEFGVDVKTTKNDLERFINEINNILITEI